MHIYPQVTACKDSDDMQKPCTGAKYRSATGTEFNITGALDTASGQQGLLTPLSNCCNTQNLQICTAECASTF